MLTSLKIRYHQGKQFIPDPTKVTVPGIFRGRPVITSVQCNTERLRNICPTGAILDNPLCLDLGKCVFCGECARLFPEKIQFTKDYFLASNQRNNLLIVEGEDKSITLDADLIRKEIRSIFKRSLKLRQVSAGGDK